MKDVYSVFMNNLAFPVSGTSEDIGAKNCGDELMIFKFCL